MGIKALARSVILQSLDDLWSEKHRAESLTFLSSNSFSVYADMAGMDTSEKVSMLEFVCRVHSGIKDCVGHAYRRSSNKGRYMIKMAG